MSYPNDPIRLLKRRLAGVSVCSLSTLALAGWWSFAPFQVPQPAIAPLEVAATPQDQIADARFASLEAAAFEAQLWIMPPKVVTEVQQKAPPPTPPPELVLLAITQEGTQRVAALYDKRQNRVFLAQVGDTIASALVAEITESAVELQHGEQRSHLALRKDQS